MSTAGKGGPPRLLEIVGAATLPWRQREIVLGDLHEEYAEVATRAGRTAANRWYVREVVRSLGPTLRSLPAHLFSPRSYTREDVATLTWFGVVAVLVTVFLAAGACGDGLPGDGAGGPSNDGPLVVEPSDVRILATSDVIAAVEDLSVLEDGSVWVQNSVEPLFVGFNAEGGVLGSHGRAGGGPEEFGAPAGFVAGGLDGEAWVFDRPRHALIRVSTPGEPRVEIPLSREAIPPGTVLTGRSLLSDMVRTARLGDEIVLPRRSGTGEIEAISFWTTIWNAALVALHPGSGSVRTVVSLPDALGDLTVHFEDLSSGFPPFPLWYRLWAVCSDDELRVHDLVRDQLRGFAADGTELAPVPVPPPFTEVTPRQFARATFDLAAAEAAGAVTPGLGDMSAADSARILDRVVPQLEGTPRQLAGVLPKFVDFRCADDGTMWLRPLDLERGGMKGGPSWLRITPDGESREVRFPERFDPYRFTGGRVWGVLRDELDVASVAWIEAPPD